MNYREAIEEAFSRVSKQKIKGELANYIPELATVDPYNFGVHLCTPDGFTFGLGNYREKFSIQSIAKVFSLTLAYKMLGVSIWQRVGVEPSGTRFNSLVQLESDNGIPRNPFINAGAIVVSDILLSLLKNPGEELLDFIKSLSSIKDIHYSPRISASERSAGYRNIAVCNFIKSFGNIINEPTDVLDFYFDLCSLEMSCEQLSALFMFLANNGITVHDNKQILTKSQSKRINALMQTCGFYDESGEFAFKVGLPGKSGVGGGIIAVHPNKYTIAVWSPELNEKGNSCKGMKFLEEFTTLSQQSIF